MNVVLESYVKFEGVASKVVGVLGSVEWRPNIREAARLAEVKATSATAAWHKIEKECEIVVSVIIKPRTFEIETPSGEVKTVPVSGDGLV